MGLGVEGRGAGPGKWGRRENKTAVSKCGGNGHHYRYRERDGSRNYFGGNKMTDGIKKHGRGTKVLAKPSKGERIREYTLHERLVNKETSESSEGKECGWKEQ